MPALPAQHASRALVTLITRPAERHHHDTMAVPLESPSPRTATHTARCPAWLTCHRLPLSIAYIVIPGVGPLAHGHGQLLLYLPFCLCTPPPPHNVICILCRRVASSSAPSPGAPLHKHSTQTSICLFFHPVHLSTRPSTYIPPHTASTRPAFIRHFRLLVFASSSSPPVL